MKNTRLPNVIFLVGAVNVRCFFRMLCSAGQLTGAPSILGSSSAFHSGRCGGSCTLDHSFMTAAIIWHAAVCLVSFETSAETSGSRAL